MRCTPHITVAGILEKDKKFLLVRELVEGHLVYNQPAGHLEYKETLLEAVQREVLEETGLYFEPQAIVGVYEYFPQGDSEVFLRFNFCGKITGAKADAVLDDGIVETVWLGLHELEAVPEREMRSSMVLQAIRDYIKNFRYPLDLVSVFDDSGKVWD